MRHNVCLTAVDSGCCRVPQWVMLTLGTANLQLAFRQLRFSKKRGSSWPLQLSMKGSYCHNGQRRNGHEAPIVKAQAVPARVVCC